MIQISSNQYEETLNKFKKARILFFVFIIFGIAIVWGISKIDVALLFFALPLFIALVFRLTIFFRKMLTRETLETARHLIMQEFKADIDTGTRYNVYAQNPKEIPTQLKEKFVPAVIEYAKKLRTWVVTIITSEDIYFISPQGYTLEPIIFAPAQKQIFDKVTEYKELLEAIGFLPLLKE